MFTAKTGFLFPHQDVTPNTTFATTLLQSLTSWNRVLLEKPAVAQPLKNFPIFYGT
jgi:hypothetical protein